MALCFNCTHGVDCAEHQPTTAGSFVAVDRHPQAGMFGGYRGTRSFTDRAAAVRYARARSIAGTPCDVEDAARTVVYRREMDVDQTRAQRGLFA